MQFNYFFLLLLFPTKQGNAEEITTNCTIERLVFTRQGKGFNLISQALEGCYFVLQTKSPSYRCCFASEKSDCETIMNYTPGNETIRPEMNNRARNEAKCPGDDKYSVKVDSSETNICTLAMSDPPSGFYQSFSSGSHRMLQQCHVITLPDQSTPNSEADEVRIHPSIHPEPQLNKVDLPYFPTFAISTLLLSLVLLVTILGGIWILMRRKYVRTISHVNWEIELGELPLAQERIELNTETQ